MPKSIPKVHLYVMGQNLYWDYGIYSSLDGMYSDAQLVYVHRGFVDARKEDKGR